MVASITQGTTTVNFTYGAEHTRIKQETNAGTTLYLADAATGITVERFEGSGGIVQWNEYLYAGGAVVGEHFTQMPAGGGPANALTRYFVADHLGSVAVITDEAGNVVERLSYDAWGKYRLPNGEDDPACSVTSETTRGYTGHETIPEACLINMNARLYDPLVARFMTPDSLVPNPFDSQSLNRFAYVTNGPLSFVDPTGNQEIVETIIVTAQPQPTISSTLYLPGALPIWLLDQFSFLGYSTSQPIALTGANTNSTSIIKRYKSTADKQKADKDLEATYGGENFNQTGDSDACAYAQCIETMVVTAQRRGGASRSGGTSGVALAGILGDDTRIGSYGIATIGLIGELGSLHANRLAKQGTFDFGGRTYKKGFFGNQYVNRDLVARAKAEQARIIRIGARTVRLTAVASLAVNLFEANQAGYSERALVRLGVGVALTGAVALTAGTTVGAAVAGVALIYAGADLLGWTDPLYVGLNATPNFGPLL